jgi:hypothetical protein
LVRFRVLRLEGDVSVTVPTSVDVTTQPAEATTRPAVDATVETTTRRAGVEDILRYVIPLTDFFGMTLAIVLCVVLLLIVMIMLVGRLIGVSHVTSAFIWCVILAVMLFPWQALLIGSKRPPTELPSPYLASSEQQLHPDFKLPGALYTWPELKRDVYFEGGLPGALKWARFVGFPVVALLLLLMVQAKSSRGLKFALGESEVQVEVTGTSV